MLICKPDKDEYISLMFWKTKQQAEIYENGKVFKSMIEQSQPFFAENSDEWGRESCKTMRARVSVDSIIENRIGQNG